MPFDIQKSANEFTNKRSVNLNDKRRDANQPAFPYMYSFVRYPYQIAVADGTTGILNNSTDADGPDGIYLTPSSTVDIPITMDRDTPFHMLWVKYGAYAASPSEGYLGQSLRALNQQPNNLYANGRTEFMAQVNQKKYFAGQLLVSVFLRSSGDRDIIGGFQRDAVTRTEQDIPISISAIQSFDDGIGQIRLPYQLAANSCVMIRVTNPTTYYMYVYGHIFGYKIPL